MPKFSYIAKDSKGVEKAGMLIAPKEKAAKERIHQMKLTIVELTEKAPNPLDPILAKLPMFGPPPVAAKDLVLFSRQLSTLVSAGVPIVQSLSILEEQAENPTFRNIIWEVREDIEAGLSISDALKKHPSAFPDIYCAMIRAGELGGILDTILERLSGFLESAEALKAKVKSAMMYPMIMLIVCGVVTVFLIMFVIPTFQKIFEGFNAELPFLTQMLVDLSDFFRDFWYVVIGGPFAFWKGVNYAYSKPQGRAWIDEKSLKSPVFGIILKKVAVAKFTRTLGTLIKSGVPIMQGLETVAATSGNVVLEKHILAARENVREGGNLATPLKASGVFPAMVTQMIGVGEETGCLDQMLEKIADFYDTEVDAAVKGLTSMIEPMVICVMGVVIGTIVIAMFMPMFEMGGMVE
ncbi:MAG: type II secretion system F family protein [Elusimicrobiota bacterium]